MTVVHNLLIRPYLLGGGIEGARLDSHDYKWQWDEHPSSCYQLPYSWLVKQSAPDIPPSRNEGLLSIGFPYSNKAGYYTLISGGSPRGYPCCISPPARVHKATWAFEPRNKKGKCHYGYWERQQAID